MLAMMLEFLAKLVLFVVWTVLIAWFVVSCDPEESHVRRRRALGAVPTDAAGCGSQEEQERARRRKANDAELAEINRLIAKWKTVKPRPVGFWTSLGRDTSKRSFARPPGRIAAILEDARRRSFGRTTWALEPDEVQAPQEAAIPLAAIDPEADRRWRESVTAMFGQERLQEQRAVLAQQEQFLRCPPPIITQHLARMAAQVAWPATEMPAPAPAPVPAPTPAPVAVFAPVPALLPTPAPAAQPPQAVAAAPPLYRSSETTLAGVAPRLRSRRITKWFERLAVDLRDLPSDPLACLAGPGSTPESRAWAAKLAEVKTVLDAMYAWLCVDGTWAHHRFSPDQAVAAGVGGEEYEAAFARLHELASHLKARGTPLPDVAVAWMKVNGLFLGVVKRAARRA